MDGMFRGVPLRKEPKNSNTMIVMPQAVVIANMTHGVNIYAQRMEQLKSVNHNGEKPLQVYPSAQIGPIDSRPLEAEMAFMQIDRGVNPANPRDNLPIVERSAYRPVSVDDNLPYIFTTLNGLSITDTTFPGLTVEAFKRLSEKKQRAVLRRMFKFVGLIQTSSLQTQGFNERRDIPVQLGGVKHIYNDSLQRFTVGDYAVWDVPPPLKELDYPPMGAWATRTSTGKEAPNKRRFILEKYEPQNVLAPSSFTEFAGSPEFANAFGAVANTNDVIASARNRRGNLIALTDEDLVLDAVVLLATISRAFEEATAAVAAAPTALNTAQLQAMLTNPAVSNAVVGLIRGIFTVQQDYASRVVGKFLKNAEPGEISAVCLSSSHVP